MRSSSLIVDPRVYIQRTKIRNRWNQLNHEQLTKTKLICRGQD